MFWKQISLIVFDYFEIVSAIGTEKHRNTIDWSIINVLYFSFLHILPL